MESARVLRREHGEHQCHFDKDGTRHGERRDRECVRSVQTCVQNVRRPAAAAGAARLGGPMIRAARPWSEMGVAHKSSHLKMNVIFLCAFTIVHIYIVDVVDPIPTDTSDSVLASVSRHASHTQPSPRARHHSDHVSISRNATGRLVPP